ncbi:hypothetical protein AALP_AA8G104500 [Arabis alpina]|uniref:Protein POLAR LOCALIZATION DURING ASYMMETRIC DIVISION AND REDISTRIBUTION-like n=1 Tax=Arabis alpina TaxID=50452 RepID=A0A087G667_ARAAL|nr:hypothetical protein AALP_AA8G104500 [Arabis alpina]
MNDGGGVRAGCIKIRCPSPRRIMSRWFSSPEKIKAKKTAMAEVRERDCDAAARIRDFSEDRHRVAEFSDSPPPTTDSELQRREFLFSIGVSCYLLHLIATSREEIHKIVELRNDLEKFLECKNNELNRKQQEFVELRNDIEKFIEFHNDELRRKKQREERSVTLTPVYSTISDVVDGPESSTTDHYYSPQFLETSLPTGREGSLKHYVLKGGEEGFSGEMDQLEAELEAEFELLQIGQDQESKCSNLKEEVLEKSVDSEGLRFGHKCPGLVEEQQGVCPYELERRLHELMETRQEEEIKELEIALEDAKKKLLLKETEASWWKDTAYIVSEHIPEPSRINSNSQSHRYPLSR